MIRHTLRSDATNTESVSGRACRWLGASPEKGTYQSGALSERDPKTAAFTVFLYGRMIGCAAEIDDNLNRGRNMDTRTPITQCTFVT